jgi:hypothetical protein
MFKALRYLPAGLIAVAVSVAAPACASQGYSYRYPAGVRVDNQAYERGFNDGRIRGEQDARHNRGFDYERHDIYRNADAGYRYGDRSEYRRVFREGFVAGYNEGFRRFAREGNVYYPPRAVPPVAAYPPYGARERYASPALANGYRDGLEQGRDDARHGRRFDPVRSSRYRSADHDYDRRFGDRDDYKQGYRTGFQQGYEQGYRESRR